MLCFKFVFCQKYFCRTHLNILLLGKNAALAIKQAAIKEVGHILIQNSILLIKFAQWYKEYKPYIFF